METGAPELTRVTFALDEPNAWHDHATETMWAEKVDDDHYRLRNVPFYAYGISFNDVVAATGGPDGLGFKQVVERGGHSTYRIFLEEDVTIDSGRFREHWNPIEEAGANYERGTEMLLAVDVPPSADINRVYDLLEAGELACVWAFEEGHCGPTQRRTTKP